MKRTIYKNHIIDKDNLERIYIYNMASQYSEESDKKILHVTNLKQAKSEIDRLMVEYEYIKSL